MNMYLLRYPRIEKFPECWIPNDDPWFEERFVSGIPVKQNHSLPIKYEADNPYPLYDYPYCAKWFLISRKFADILKTLTPDYQEFPSEIYYKGHLRSRDFISFVFTRAYEALDMDRSVYRSVKVGLVFGLKKIVLAGSKLETVLENTQIFRLNKSTSRIIMTEKARQSIEEAGIKPVAFQELEVSS